MRLRDLNRDLTSASPCVVLPRCLLTADNRDGLMPGGRYTRTARRLYLSRS